LKRNIQAKEELDNEEQQSSERKIYKTVDPSIKAQILVNIKKGLLLMTDLDFDTKPVSSSRFLELIDKVDFQDFTKLVLRVILKYVKQVIFSSL